MGIYIFQSNNITVSEWIRAPNEEYSIPVIDGYLDRIMERGRSMSFVCYAFSDHSAIFLCFLKSLIPPLSQLLILSYCSYTPHYWYVQIMTHKNCRVCDIVSSEHLRVSLKYRSQHTTL